MKYWPMIALVLLTGCHKNQPLSPLASTSNPATPKTFVLMGQSNMNGQPFSDEYPNDPNITLLYAPHGRRGPGYTFAMNETKAGNSVVLIQCAMDGTRIRDWVPGGQWYQQCMGYIQLANVKHIDGVLFYQGESDSGDASEPWAQEFTALVRDLKSKFNNVPVVYAQIGECNDPGQTSNLQNFQAEQATISVQGTDMITTNDIAPEDQGWHHGYDGNITIGNRFYEAFKQL